MYLIILLSLVLTSCTYSLNVIHTQGTADDLVDENQTADPTVNPYLNFPT